MSIQFTTAVPDATPVWLPVKAAHGCTSMGCTQFGLQQAGEEQTGAGCSLRGRHLQGDTITLPEGYQGIVSGTWG